MKLVLIYHEGDDFYGDTLRTLPLEYESKEKLIEDIQKDVSRVIKQIEKWKLDIQHDTKIINELWRKNLNKSEYDTLWKELQIKFPVPTGYTFLNIHNSSLWQFEVFTLDEWFEKYKN